MSLWNELLDTEVVYETINSYKTRYIKGGQGAPIVFVHGTGGHLENFSRLFAELKKDFTVYCLDLVGYGLSEKPSDLKYDVPTWGAHLESFLKEVVKEPVYLVGHSLGGWVSSWVALKSPEYVKKLVLLTSVGFELTEQEGQVLARFYESQQSASLDSITKDAVRKRLQMLVMDHSSIPEEWVDLRHNIYNRSDTKQVMRKWVDYIPCLLQQNKEVKPYLLSKENVGQLNLPLLFLIADQDPFTPVEVVQRLIANHPLASCYVVENAGHWPHVEKSKEVLHVLKTFITTS